jgi:hypothetical protein
MTPMMTDVLFKASAEVLGILAIATKEIDENYTSKLALQDG